MKTEKHITTIITVLFLGFITLNGQTATRSETRDNRERTTVKKTEARKTTVKPQRQQTTQARQNRVQPQRQQTTQARQTTRTRETRVQPQRQQTKHVQQQRGTNQGKSTTRYRETATRTNPGHSRPVSISTPRNPKSDYRAPGHKPHMKNNKYSDKRYYSGNYYHHVYPNRMIKTHYHHNTYIHHYNVLYYPAYHEIYWTHNMYRDYRRWYPNYNWRYDYGYRIQTISVFDAKYKLGEVAMVYGRVYATWHNQETDDYLLFFGGDYPAQQFTVVLPGRVARKINWRPERYFLGEHITITGLITTFDGIPEIIIKDRRQVDIY